MSETVIDLTSELIKIPTLTPYGETKAEEREKFKICEICVDSIDAFLKDRGAKTQKLVFEGGSEKWPYPVPNLYAEMTFGDVTAKNHKFICYMGHIDVVPTVAENLWQNKSPFSGKLEEGYVKGRGATDMKASVAAMMSTFETLHDVVPEGANLTIGAIITGDEEWAAVNGTDKVLQWMKKEGKNPEAFLVGEPSSQDFLGTHIKVGRRGSLTGLVDVKGIAGHVANEKGFKNPINAMSSALILLEQKTWKDGNRYFPNTNLEIVSVESGKIGQGTNVIPERAQANYNIRFTPKQTPEKLLNDLREIILNPPKFMKKLPDYQDLVDNIDTIISANIASASYGYYAKPDKFAESAKRAISEVLGVTTNYDGAGGSTDGRFVHNYFPKAQIIELGVPERGGIIGNERPKGYEKRGGMHQIDERVAVKDVVNLQKVYQKTIQNYAKGR
ncbi:MAG: succinyl-diaminopimelate desuccinylase [Alphaproteobacteria bacterium]|nr:succinyl-diaminopimelate desuccinylase [Alphaproteobacteria bacterium]